MMRWLLSVLLLIAGALPAHAIPRDQNARNEFKRLNPCPITQRAYGACPGWEVDHRVPLKCGGADRPHNMQWLTVADHRAKTKREAKQCRKKYRRH